MRFWLRGAAAAAIAVAFVVLGVAVDADGVAGARAAEMTLRPAAAASSYSPPGRKIDIDGLVPGMSVEQVKAALLGIYGPVQGTQDNFGFADNGVFVTTQPFVARMAARKDATEIAVLFAAPTTGNGLVQINKQVVFPSGAGAPTIDSVRAELIAKYGAPAMDRTPVVNGEVKLLAWSFKGNAPSACAEATCQADLVEGLSLADLSRYQQSVRNGHDFMIVAVILTGLSDPTRAASLALTASDMATKFRSVDEAYKQMRVAARPAAAAKPGATKPEGKPEGTKPGAATRASGKPAASAETAPAAKP